MLRYAFNLEHESENPKTHSEACLPANVRVCLCLCVFMPVLYMGISWWDAMVQQCVSAACCCYPAPEMKLKPINNAGNFSCCKQQQCEQKRHRQSNSERERGRYCEKLFYGAGADVRGGTCRAYLANDFSVLTTTCASTRLGQVSISDFDFATLCACVCV